MARASETTTVYKTGGRWPTMNANKKIEIEDKKIEPAKKSYVKPTVIKHAAATQIVGSCGCGVIISTDGGGYYYV
jgi:hypothetical protein